MSRSRRRRGEILAVIFNLGHLTGANKEATTHPDPTLIALHRALKLPARGGVLSVFAYRDTEG